MTSEEQSSEFVYCKHCSKVFTREAETRSSITERGLVYTMIGPDEKIECDRTRDLVLPHLPKYEGCGKDAIVIYGWYTQLEQGQRKRRKLCVESDDDSVEKVSKQTCPDRGLKVRAAVRDFFSKHFNQPPSIIIPTKESKYNTYIVSFGSLTHEEMIHPQHKVLMSSTKSQGVSSCGVLFPSGFKTVSALKEYLFVTEICYEDDTFETPLYKVAAYKRVDPIDKQDKATYEFIAQTPEGFEEVVEVFAWFATEHDIHVQSSAYQTIVAIQYSSVKAVLIEHFLNLPVDSSLCDLLLQCK